MPFPIDLVRWVMILLEFQRKTLRVSYTHHSHNRHEASRERASQLTEKTLGVSRCERGLRCHRPTPAPDAVYPGAGASSVVSGRKRVVRSLKANLVVTRAIL
jgi:hypothetical protein